MNPYSNCFALNNGMRMPLVGVGTFRIRHEEPVMKVVDEALAAGYRLFDTAPVYHNEKLLSKAFRELLPKYKLDRDDIFVTTKLDTDIPALSVHEIKNRVEEMYQNSIDNLGLEFADLYLINHPGVHKLEPSDERNAELRLATWEAMVELYNHGRVNAIGVSNFTLRHLKELIQRSHGVIPAVNQVEWHPFYYQTDLLHFCNANTIMLQAYHSFGGASVLNHELMNHRVIVNAARKLGVTNAQVLLAWAVQQDIGVIPKSTNPHHIRQNITLNFRIPDDVMESINSLGIYDTNYTWHPTDVR